MQRQDCSFTYQAGSDILFQNVPLKSVDNVSKKTRECSKYPHASRNDKRTTFSIDKMGYLRLRAGALSGCNRAGNSLSSMTVVKTLSSLKQSRSWGIPCWISKAATKRMVSGTDRRASSDERSIRSTNHAVCKSLKLLRIQRQVLDAKGVDSTDGRDAAVVHEGRVAGFPGQKLDQALGHMTKAREMQPGP